MNNTQTWQAALAELQLQMTQATFDTWIRGTTATQQGNTFTVTVKNAYALDWLQHRLQATIKRTLVRLTQQPVNLKFVVQQQEPQPSSTGAEAGPPADPRPGLIPQEDPDPPPTRQFAIELVHFDPRERGHVRISNYAWKYWQPYLAAQERQAGSRTGGVAFCLWGTLKSFVAHWGTNGYDRWPSIQTMADTVCNSNRHRILGRGPRGQDGTSKHRKASTGAIEILENERIVWMNSRGAGRMTEYILKVRNTLPLLTPTQVSQLTPRLQERHTRELAKCEVNFQEWEQLTLPTLLPE